MIAGRRYRRIAAFAASEFPEGCSPLWPVLSAPLDRDARMFVWG